MSVFKIDDDRLQSCVNEKKRNDNKHQIECNEEAKKNTKKQMNENWHTIR